ncbi:MAG: MurR/RpiR family transcriptional regulator [Candidatus Accumulibacter sp.]|jgi:DNA-binding MurR/RpiR family transcriptional regulator|nr:MurR/RpiR family transcriptional regulator [Accumulibacter sp.]
MDAKELILEKFPALPARMQDAARFVIDRPNEVVVSSMRTVAKRAGVQPATFVRFAQHLGYSGWPELKAAFAADLGLQPERYGQRAKSLARRGHDPHLSDELFVAQRENLDVTEKKCASVLWEAVSLLKRATKVHVAGFRASFPIAYSFVYGYRLFRNSVYLIDGQNGNLEMQTRLLDASGVVMAISFAPYSKEAIQVIDAARRAGTGIIALTDSEASPLALAADVTVLFSVNSPSFFPSVAAAVALSEALLQLLLVATGDAAVQKLEEAEKQLYESGAYLQRPQKVSRSGRRPSGSP